MAKIAITMGDPAGIGAEIIIKALNKLSDVSNLVVIGNRDIFRINEDVLGLQLPKNIEFLDIQFSADKIQAGIESEHSGELSYLCLKRACEMANSGEISAIATAPLSKNALHLAGHNYSGQTEILQKELANGVNKAQMLFVADKLRVLLLTRHLSLKNVPNMIKEELIAETTEIFDNELKTKFGIHNPMIAMCALNPHSGENGLLGDEEIAIINPTIEKLSKKGINISGSYSADTLLGNAVKNYKNPQFDGYIACYHDQALPAIKSLGLGNVLNVTIGLKVLRVSPSHGTAFDIAYQNKADSRSMLKSIKYIQSL